MRYKCHMAKKKQPMPPTTQDPPKPTNRHKGIQIPTRLPPEVYAVVEQIAEREHRKVAQMGLVLILEALEARGAYSPPSATSD